MKNIENFDQFQNNIDELLKRAESGENIDYYAILENLGINYKEIDDNKIGRAHV